MKTAILVALLAAPVLSQQHAVTSRVENLGGGCRSMSGAALRVVAPAVIGKAARFAWATPSVPNLHAWLAFGVTDPRLQLETGCTIHVLPQVLLPVQPTGSLCLPVPNDNALLGSSAIVQMAVASTVIPADFSDAYRLTIGN